MKLMWLAAAALSITATAPATAQAIEVPAPAGAWVHTASGVSFPATSGEMKRVKIQKFDDEETDVGVTYQLIRGGTLIGVTMVYIYPAGGSCDGTWDIEKEGTISNDNKVLSEGVAPSPGGKTQGVAHKSTLDMGLSQEGNPISTSGYFYCVPGGKWLVKYYSSWKGTDDKDFEAVKLLRSIGWPAAFR